MFSKKHLSLFIAGLTLFTALPFNAAAAEPVVTSAALPEFDQKCSFEAPDDHVYDIDIITVRKKMKVASGEQFEVKVFAQNNGNTPLNAPGSFCPGLKTYLGTDLERDRKSTFYGEELTGWTGPNRIAMDQNRVEPGEIMSFTFMANAPMENAVYKEYFTPVIEGVQWVDSGQFDFDVIVGNPETSYAELRKKMNYAGRSGNVDEIVDLDAPVKIMVDLSDQEMKILLGETEIDKFKVSTGASRTPTPTGTHTILAKQDVRIGGAAPHYIMPKFQSLGINGRRFTGYGIHALPSLGSYQLRARIRSLQQQGLAIPTSLYADDTLWNEAVDHLGTPVSHGCIRVAPEKADLIHQIADVGTTVEVQW